MANADNPMIQVSDGLWLSKSIVDGLLSVAEAYTAHETARLNRLGLAQTMVENITNRFRDTPTEFMALAMPRIQELVSIEAQSMKIRDPQIIRTAISYVADDVERMKRQKGVSRNAQRDGQPAPGG